MPRGFRELRIEDAVAYRSVLQHGMVGFGDIYVVEASVESTTVIGDIQISSHV